MTATTFETALEENGIDVDSTMEIMGDVSVMYEYDPESKLTDLATVALLYAEAPQISPNVLSVTPIRTTGPEDERVANYSVPRGLAEQYREDEISKEEYIQSVLDTWTPYGDGGSA